MTGSAAKQAFDPSLAGLCVSYTPRAENAAGLSGQNDQLARRRQAAVCRQTTNYPHRATPVVHEDHSQRDQLILEHMSLVHAIAFQVQRGLPIHIEIDDLKHAGMMGLFEAATKYEPTKEVAFRSYAKHRIRGAILDSLRDMDWASRDLRRRHKQVETAKRSLTETLGREPSAPELADAIGVGMQRFRAMMVDFRSVSLAAVKIKSTREGEEGVQTEAPCTAEALPDHVFAKTEMRSRINDAMHALPRRYQKVVFLYYNQELTMREIGVAMGVNESRVSQMHRSALAKMQSFLTQSGIASTNVF